jgi:predicted nuclease of predicted toxin-antitoxin system
MRFLVDENLPPSVVAVLVSQGAEVEYVADSRLAGRNDEVIWKHAIENQQILVTLDLDFPLSLEEGPPGLVLLRVPSSYNGSSIAATLSSFLERTSIERLHGAITVVLPGRHRRRTIPNA